MTPGTRLGTYEIISLLGQGGMGEVYRARDTKLNRDVALKILPDAFAHDPERLARFRREAQVLASLNHPNIGAIYGLEEGPAEAGPYARALVLELVEGPTLADRIVEGPIAVEEGLPIARQIAEALEAAHDAGVIHRDLKPANVKVRPDGTVKVLDFGLAKAMDASSGSVPVQPDLTASPTITTPAHTMQGAILGTAAYMSPEQAKGQPLDRRTDVWAFGAVLYEMLTGQRAFEGDDVSDTLANVLKVDPNWAALPDEISPTLVPFIKRCLHRDVRQRTPDVATLRLAMEGAFETPGGRLPEQVDARSPLRLVAVGGLVAGALVVGAALVAVVMLMTNAAPTSVTRLKIAPSPPHALATTARGPKVALSPDGKRIAYIDNDETLLVRDLDRLEPTVLVRGSTASTPFFSPDGEWVGYFPAGQALRKVRAEGGPSERLGSDSGVVIPGGATWAADGTVVLSTGSASVGLRLVSPDSQDLRVLTAPDRARNEGGHLWPRFLPGDRALLFTITAANGDPDDAQVAVLDLATGDHRVVVPGSDARYVPTGHLVYSAAGTIHAVPFELDRLETRGESVDLGTRVFTTRLGGANFDVSADGTLVYVPDDGTSVDRDRRELVWVARDGTEESLDAPLRPYWYPRLSPDGTRVLVDIIDVERSVWQWDLQRRTLTNLTGVQGGSFPMWNPDGTAFFFTSGWSGQSGIYRQAADGAGEAELLNDECGAQQTAGGVTPDGQALVFDCAGDLFLLALDDAGEVTPLVHTPAGERRPSLSPDGQWLAYHGGDAGRPIEVYVRPFPAVDSGRFQVSTAGGVQPWWSPAGDELFYFDLTGAVMSVSVGGGDTWSASPPARVLDKAYVFNVTGAAASTIDVSAEDGRLLMIRPVRPRTDSESGPVEPQIVVVQDWFEELARLVPPE